MMYLEIAIFATLFIVSFGMGAFTVKNYYYMMMQAQPREVKTSLVFKIKSVVINVLLQRKLFKRPVRGFFHALVFYGFLVYGVHTTSQIIGGFIGNHQFYLPALLGHSIEYAYDFSLDIASLTVLTGLAFFASRRWIFKAPELDRPSGQSFIILTLIKFLMVFTIIGEPAKMILNNVQDLNPIRAFLVDTLKALNLEGQAGILFEIGWWGHILTVFILTIYVPRSKHAHLIWAPLNFVMASGEPKGAIRYMDVENATSWGASNIQDFTWKNMLDGLSCIECGRCQLECPAHRTGKQLSPKDIMTDMKHAFMEMMPLYLAQKNSGKTTEEMASDSSLRVIDSYVSTESLWACTTCYACVEACPVGNNQVDAIIEMRRALVLNEGNLPAELQNAMTNIENQSNPWGVGSHKREEWAEGLDIKTMAKWKEAGDVPEVLFWVGCAGAFDDRNKKISQSLAKLMNKADIKFGILGTEENCTGDSARRAGNEYLFQTMAQTNIETMNNYGVKKIVTACPHCFNTIKNEYPQFGGSYEVEHHSVFLDKLVSSGKLEIDDQKVAQNTATVAYHDSCYLGRYNDNYSAPRSILEKSVGTKVLEASDSKKTSLCCGAGGAQMWKEEENGTERVNIKRTNQLLDTKAKSLATACPFCITMISDGVNASGKGEQVKVLDITEILEQSVK